MNGQHRSSNNALIDLLSDILLERQQPDAKGDLVVHLGTRILLEYINETVRDISARIRAREVQKDTDA